MGCLCSKSSSSWDDDYPSYPVNNSAIRGGGHAQSYAPAFSTTNDWYGQSYAAETGGRRGWNGQSYTVTSSGTNSRGNRWDHRDYGKGTSESYHYSNADGSYYYANPDGSTYYNDGRGGSKFTLAKR